MSHEQGVDISLEAFYCYEPVLDPEPDEKSRQDTKSVESCDNHPISENLFEILALIFTKSSPHPLLCEYSPDLFVTAIIVLA